MPLAELAIVDGPLYALSLSGFTTSAVLSGTPGETIALSIEGPLMPLRELTRITFGADGTVPVSFTLSWDEWVFVHAFAQYVIDGVPAGPQLSLWNGDAPL